MSVQVGPEYAEDKEILVKRKCVYQQAKSQHPERWSGEIRNWDKVDEVFLNPEKQKKVAALLFNFRRQLS
jgi:hypothetical protein